MIRPVHPNADRFFCKGDMNGAVAPSPRAKFYRYRPDESIQHLANQLRKYITIYKLDRRHYRAILEPEFGESIGNDTFEIFLDPVYGVGMVPREKSLKKYRYLLRRLKEIHGNIEDKSCNSIDV